MAITRTRLQRKGFFDVTVYRSDIAYFTTVKARSLMLFDQGAYNRVDYRGLVENTNGTGNMLRAAENHWISLGNMESLHTRNPTTLSNSRNVPWYQVMQQFVICLLQNISVKFVAIHCKKLCCSRFLANPSRLLYNTSKGTNHELLLRLVTRFFRVT
jgi:hypothetical protein